MLTSKTYRNALYFRLCTNIYVAFGREKAKAKGEADLGLACLELQKRQPKLAAAGYVRHRCAERCPGGGRVARDAVLEPGQLHVQIRPGGGVPDRSRHGGWIIRRVVEGKVNKVMRKRGMSFRTKHFAHAVSIISLSSGGVAETAGLIASGATHRQRLRESQEKN